MDFDKKMMNDMFSRAGSDDTRKAMNKFLEISRTDPQTLIMMAMFRDMFIVNAKFVFLPAMIATKRP